MAMIDPPMFATPGRAQVSRFWTNVEETIQGYLDDGPKHPRQMVMNVPLAMQDAPQTGDLILSLGVGSFNCRVVGYQIWSLVPGVLTIDIERSTPATHAAASGSTPYHFPSIVGGPGLWPSLNGPYAEQLDTSGWADRELSAGDMLHIWCKLSDGAIQYAFLELYLQDTVEKT